VSKKPSGLGKGLDALLPKTQAALVRLPLALIKPGSSQPRRNFSAEALDELAASIKEKGLLQPLLVRPKGQGYELVAGERRWRAAQLAGLQEVPALIRDITDREALELALVENLQREDLNPVEEAQGYQRLAEMGLSQEEIARAVGKARTTVTNALRLLQLPKGALAALEAGEITPGHARALLALPGAKREWGLREILSKNLNVRDSERLKERAEQPVPKAPARREAYPEIAQSLSRQLGWKVRLVGEKKGRLEIQYHSREELEAILERLGYQS